MRWSELTVLLQHPERQHHRNWPDVPFCTSVRAARRYTWGVILVWIGVAVVAGVAVIAWVATRRPRVDYTQLGTMSEQWVAEQRANDRPY